MEDGKPKYWWWNGRWGRLARRDIKIFAEPNSRFRVEDWRGGIEGRMQEYPGLDEAAARAQAESLADNGGKNEALAEWRDMSEIINWS